LNRSPRFVYLLTCFYDTLGYFIISSARLKRIIPTVRSEVRIHSIWCNVNRL